MELEGKSVKMANVQRAKIVMEGIVEECVIYREVARRLALRPGGDR
jgi:hypothetical protein